MHNTRLSIFILPVLIIGLSVFTTFVEENPSFRSLFQISQVANPSVNEEGQDLIDRAESESITEDIVAEDTVTEGDIADSETTVDQENVTRDNEASEENGVREQSEQNESQEAPSPDVEVDSSSENSETPNQTESSTEETVEVTQSSEDQQTEEEVNKEIEDAELLALKISQFEVARSNISYRLQANLSRLESARDSLADKIAQMEQSGKDTTQAKDALMNLDQAITNSRRYIKDSTKPESISGIQRVLTEYVKNARDSIQEGYTALFQAIQDAQ